MIYFYCAIRLSVLDTSVLTQSVPLVLPQNYCFALTGKRAVNVEF